MDIGLSGAPAHGFAEDRAWLSRGRAVPLGCGAVRGARDLPTGACSASVDELRRGSPWRVSRPLLPAQYGPIRSLGDSGGRAQRDGCGIQSHSTSLVWTAVRLRPARRYHPLDIRCNHGTVIMSSIPGLVSRLTEALLLRCRRLAGHDAVEELVNGRDCARGSPSRRGKARPIPQRCWRPADERAVHVRVTQSAGLRDNHATLYGDRASCWSGGWSCGERWAPSARDRYLEVAWNPEGTGRESRLRSALQPYGAAGWARRRAIRGCGLLRLEKE